MTLGERVKRIRKDAKMTQKEFAAAIGVGWVAVAGCEQGRISLGKARLYVIADRFKVNPQWLLNGSGDIYRDDAINDATQDAREMEVIKKLFLALPKSYQDKILVALREMVATGKIMPVITSNKIDISGTVNGNVDIQQNNENKGGKE